MYTIRKQFKFEMSHQLFKSYSAACHEAIHGHSYILELFLSSDGLDDTGMVIDFGEVKSICGDWINTWDHCLVMPTMFDKEYLEMLSKYNKKMIITQYNPTAENMAREMWYTISYLLSQAKRNINVSKVRLHETTTGWAEYTNSINEKVFNYK